MAAAAAASGERWRAWTADGCTGLRVRARAWTADECEDECEDEALGVVAEEAGGGGVDDGARENAVRWCGPGNDMLPGATMLLPLL